ncbi:sensor histidine kinase [Rurimicrobium arvi]|uniref:Histidine kinase n=1 Tax=Rurimicrobium arvi TaxID=2049916 RepID=A0ABP8MJU6_9BACT
MLHYTINNGLASNTIYDIYKDPKGLFWLGTDKGISRFNGLTFENFTTADGLSDNECFFFRPDQCGRLWIGTYNGHLCFYKNGTFYNEKNTPWLKLPFVFTHTTDIVINKDTSISFFFKEDHPIVEIKDQKVTILNSESIPLKYKYYLNTFKYARKVSDHRYLLIYKTEALIFNFRTGRVEKEVPIYPRVKNVTFKQGRLILILENDDLYTIDDAITLNKVTHYNNSKNAVLNQLLCNETDTFFVANSGIEGNNGQRFEEVSSAFSAIVDKKLLLVGTAADGLFLFDLDHKIRNKLYPKPEGRIDHAQFVNDELLLLDKRKAVSIYQRPSFQKIKSIDVHQFSQLIPTLNFIRNNYFYSLCRDTNYRISLATDHPKPEIIEDLDFNTSINYYADRDTDLVTEIRHKIVRLDVHDLEKKRLITVKAHFGIGEPLISLFGFAERDDKTIWVSTAERIYQIRSDNFVPQPQFGNLAFREMVFMKQYLVGISDGNRLVVCRDHDERSVSADTLDNNGCVWNKFLKLNDSTLFITTNNYPRLLRFFSRSGKNSFRIRTLDNPFIPYQPDYVTATDSGLMMFAKGEMFLFPDKYLAQQKTMPGVHFTYITSGNRKIPVTDTIALSFNDAQDLKIKFQPVSFFNTVLTYEYAILSGNKKGKWVSIQGEELNLIKLFFGNHIIKVRAKTLSGEYSIEAVFVLKVNKPWWAQWWFLICCLAALVILVSLAARWNIKRRLRKKENEVRFLISEYRSLNALMNPHFVFNSLNSLQSMVNNHETAPASRYIRIFSNLLRQNMHNMTHDLIPITKEIDLIENYLKLEKLRFKEKLNYTINIDPDADLTDIRIPPLLIQPLVENAIKHGIWPQDSKDAKLEIDVNEEHDRICVRIRHNGAPLGTAVKSDTSHESYAVENIRQRIDHLNRIHRLEITYSIYNIEKNEAITGVECMLCIPGFPQQSEPTPPDKE